MNNKQFFKFIPWIVFLIWILGSIISYSSTHESIDNFYEDEMTPESNIAESEIYEGHNTIEDNDLDEEYENIKTLPDDYSSISEE